MNKITTKIQSKKIAHFMILWAALRSLINANNYRRLMKKYHGRYKFIAAIGFGYQTVKITYEMFLKLRYYFVKLEQAKHVKKFTSADLDPNLCKLALGDTDPGTKFRFTTEFSKVGVAYDLEIAAKHKEKASSALDKIETFLRGKNMLGKRPCTLGSTYSVSLLRAKENILRDDCRGIWGPLSKKLDKLLVEMEKSDEFTGIFESRFIPNYCGCFETLHATEPDLRTVEASTIVDSFINHCHMAKEDALKFISSMDLKDVKAFKQLRKNGSRIKDQEHFKQLKTENLQQAEQVEKSVGKRETFLSRESKNAHLKLKLERIYADLFYLDHDVAYLNDEIKFNQDLMTKANYTPELVRFYFDKIFINKVDAIVERFVDKIIENPESQLLGSLKDELKKIEHKFQERDSESETESSKPEEWFSNSYLERSIDEGAPNQELTDLFDGSNVTSRIRAYVQRISDNNLDKEDVTQALMCLLQAQGIIESPNS